MLGQKVTVMEIFSKIIKFLAHFFFHYSIKFFKPVFEAFLSFEKSNQEFY